MPIVENNSKQSVHASGWISAPSYMSVWRRRMATIAAAALAMMMAYGVIFGHNGITAFAHKREEAKFLQQQTMQLQRENERLQDHVQLLESDPDSIEREARAKLHYTHAGEVIVTLPPAPAKAPLPTQRRLAIPGTFSHEHPGPHAPQGRSSSAIW